MIHGVHCICGKPGGGKSYLATEDLIKEELIKGERYIVTNLPLDVGEIADYLARHNPNHSVDLFKRLRILDDEELKMFWRYRKNITLDPVTIEENKRTGKMPNFDPVTQDPDDFGTCYYLDEVQNIFNARNWMTTGPIVLFYMSQHRHLGDSVIWLTQSINNVDKQFRSVTQDYTQVRNFAKEKFGWFRSFSSFEKAEYLEPPGGNAKPMRTERFKLDPEIAKCYDTTGGVGIKGNKNKKADMGNKAKGLPIWIMFAIPVLCLAGIIFLTRSAPS